MKKIVTDINNNIYLEESNIKLNKYKDYIENNVIIVYKDKVINKNLKMGGAITEAVAYNYSKLPDEKKLSFINDMYSLNGLNYNYGRVTIGSCDFSLSSYDYIDNKDLSSFSLERDKKYLIPMLNDIYNSKKIDLIATPWTPPKSFKKKNKLKEYSLFVKYIKKYINEYNNLGFNIKYITPQNEPMVEQEWESCTYTFNEQKKLIYDYLIKELNDTNTSILLWDHNRENLPFIMDKLYEDNEKVKGLAFHWYSGRFYNNIRLVHQQYPNLLLINTEMCCGFSEYNENTWINDAELYLKDIISCFNNGVSIYLDWNILLNYSGGPNHKNNYCKSPLILNEEENDYIKTPIYYYLTHISKYINDDYEVVEVDKYNEELYVLSLKKEDNEVVVILNTSNNSCEFNLLIDNYYLNDIINSHSIITYIK